MLKKILTVTLMILAAVTVNAQQPQIQSLPLNPDVKHGTLPNGMQYFIMHNELPKERANFYIAQKVGSTLETQEQLGLAHFLEHMAFNGTKNYPGKNMLNYLQSKGIRFGADINAYTDFDETVYNIDNVPTTDKALMDSVLLVLHDWSSEILLEEDEINAERGVIEEEWRSRNDANFRMMETILPKLYQEYQYQQMPIGKMEVVRNFSPETLRAYYKKWYRPDQQGIVIVGDFDAEEMEKKVKDLFSPIPMPENAAPRTYPTVSDNKEPIFVYFEDPELQWPRFDISFKMEKTPFEMRNTVPAYLQDIVLKNLISSLINNRLSEYQQKPECKYAMAAVFFGNYYVSKTKGAFQVVAIGKNDADPNLAFEEAMSIVARACKTGFTDSELQRVKDEMISSYESSFNERKNTHTASFAKELIRFFVDNTPAPGIENELNLIKQALPAIPVQAINAVCQQLLTPENQVVAVSMPKKEGMTVITKEEFLPRFNNILNKEYEAYVDEVITEPLISQMPKPGKVTAIKDDKFGTKVMELSNGVKVIVKNTDFKADDIQMMAFRAGGKRSYAPSQAPNVILAGDVFSVSKFGNFDINKLRKYLSGKQVGISYGINNTINVLQGSSTKKDLNTLMELVYTAFTNLNPDDSTYNALMNQARTIVKSYEVNPERIFKAQVLKSVYGNNPMFNQLSMATIEAANYREALSLVKKSMSNAAEYTFVFVGNVDADTLKPLLEKYIASIPGVRKKNEVVKDLSSIKIVSGKVNDTFKQPMQTPSTQVTDYYMGTNLSYSVENSIKISLLGDILDNTFTETLREEEGGTYSPSASASLNPFTGQWNIYYNFQTNKDQQAKLMNRANEELMKLLQNGTDDVNFNKVREAMLKQYDIALRNNNYWLSSLVSVEQGIDGITGFRETLEKLTLSDFNKFMKNLYNGENRIEVVMEGVPASK